MNTIETFKTSIKTRDFQLMSNSLEFLRENGYRYRDCYRLALAADPSMGEAEYEDLMAELDDWETRRAERQEAQVQRKR